MPAAPAAVTLSATGGSDPSVDFTGTAVNLRGGVHINKYGATSSTGPTWSFGGAVFAGVGGQVYYNSSLQSVSQTSNAPLGNRPIEAWDVNGNPIETYSNWDENVVSSDPNLTGSESYRDSPPGAGRSPYGGPAGATSVPAGNFYGYTGPGPTSLSNPFGSWGPSFGGPIQGSIFGPNNYYSGLTPVPGSTWGEGFRGSGPP
jgi:hypothetical protein